jgi:signal transduction protein with GAF and PtsI domain
MASVATLLNLKFFLELITMWVFSALHIYISVYLCSMELGYKYMRTQVCSCQRMASTSIRIGQGIFFLLRNRGRCLNQSIATKVWHLAYLILMQLSNDRALLNFLATILAKGTQVAFHSALLRYRYKAFTLSKKKVQGLHDISLSFMI